MSGGTFGGVVRTDESWTHVLDFEKADAAVDPSITVTGEANRTKIDGASNLVAATGARIQHKTVGRTNTLKSAIDMSDAAYWLQNAGGWWVSTASFDKAPPKRGAKVTKYVRTAAAAGDAVFARCNSLSIPAGARSASAYFYVPSGQGISTFKVRADWQDALGGTYTDSSAFDQWVRIESVGTTVSTASFLDLNIQVDGFNAPATGFTFYCAAPQESDALSEWIPTAAAPVTVYDSLGLLQEPSNVSGVSNAIGVGAVVGTPGTLPTYWTRDVSAGQNMHVVGTGLENGMAYVDVRFFSAGNDRSYHGLLFEPYGTCTATPGEKRYASVYVKHVGGTLAGVHQIFNRATNAASGLLADTAIPFTPANGATVNLRDARVGIGHTMPALTAFALPIYVAACAVGPAFDYTLRFALPNMASGLTPLMPVPSAYAPLLATEARHVISGNAFAQYFKGQGTYLIEFTPVTLTNNEVYWGIAQDGVFNNSLYILNSSGYLYLIVYSAGANTVALDLGLLTAGVRHKVAISFKSGEVAARCNGGIERVSSGALPVTISAEGLLTSPWSGGSGGVNAYMHRRRFRPYPSRGQLYQLTA